MARGRKSGKSNGPRDALIEAMTRLVGEAKDGAKPVSKRVLRRLRKLAKELVAARATETRRLNQLSTAQESKGGRHVARRLKQAGKAAGEVAAIAGKIAEIAASVAGGTAGSVGDKGGGEARDARSPAAQALETVSPVKVPSRGAAVRTGAAGARSGVARAAKPATTAKPRAAAKRASTATRASTAKPRAAATRASTPPPRKRPGSADGSAGNSSS